MPPEPSHIKQQRSIHAALKENILYPQYKGRKWYYAFLILASLFLFSFVNIELSMRFEYFNVLLFLLGIAALAIGLTSAFSPYQILRGLRFQFFALAGALVGSTILGGITLNLQTQWTIQKAAPILDALGKYQLDHQQFPASLSALIPEYLPKIPNTSMGIFPREYLYIHLPQEKKFFLYFDVEGSDLVYRYNSYYDSWDASDSKLIKLAKPI